jgi:putative membrane protein
MAVERASRGIRWWELALPAAGLLLLALLVYAAGPGAIADQLRRLGWSVLPAFLPYVAVYTVDTLGWWWILRRAFAAEAAGHLPSIPGLFAVRAAGEAVNAVTPTAYLGGEPVKAWLLRRRGVPLAPAFASALVSKTALMLTQGVFVFLGLLIGIQRWGSLPLPLALALGLALVGLLAAALIGLQRRSPFTLLLGLSRRWSGRQELLGAWEQDAATLDALLKNFYDRRRADLLGCCCLHFLGWTVGSLEVLLVLGLLGTPVDFPTAFAIEALAGVAKLAALVVPASLGVQEGGQILIFAAFGLDAPTALAFSLVRRARELLWIAYGLLVLWRERGATCRRA